MHSIHPINSIYSIHSVHSIHPIHFFLFILFHSVNSINSIHSIHPIYSIHLFILFTLFIPFTLFILFTIFIPFTLFIIFTSPYSFYSSFPIHSYKSCSWRGGGNNHINPKWALFEKPPCALFLNVKNINFLKLHFFGKSSYIINFLNDILSKILDMTWNVKYLKIFATFSKLDVWSRRTEFSQNWRSLYCLVCTV